MLTFAPHDPETPTQVFTPDCLSHLGLLPRLHYTFYYVQK